MTDIEKLQDMVDHASKIVFFGGAGVSTESGIPDFRSQDGLYASAYDNVPPEDILSAACFRKRPALFYKFYNDKILMKGSSLDIKPNAAHLKLVELEKAGKLTAVVTQNIDTLHQQAGSRNVYQIHGTIATNHCCICHREYSLGDIMGMGDQPLCECGGLIKPDVTLYGENLPGGVWERAVEAVTEADMLIVAGTSLSVYPAASLLDYFHGDKLVIINMTSTPSDYVADLVIHDSIGKVLGGIKVEA